VEDDHEEAEESQVELEGELLGVVETNVPDGELLDVE
jgi:hypothetical protein